MKITQKITDLVDDAEKLAVRITLLILLIGGLIKLIRHEFDMNKEHKTPSDATHFQKDVDVERSFGLTRSLSF